MTDQEYRHIRNLSWDLLLDARIKSLPVDLPRIARLYTPMWRPDPKISFFENAVDLSGKILVVFGIQNSAEYAESLAVRVVAPIIVFQMLDVNSAEEIAEISNIPLSFAHERFRRYLASLSRGTFGISKLERRVANQFWPWVSRCSQK